MTASKSERPLVSIGVPVFNGERYLRQCLDSLLGQDYPDIEVLVCDNASTDATPDICREYAGRDPRVRYHRSAQNVGAVLNFRRALELARGEYYMWAAFDDLRAPQYVSRCVEALERDPSAVMCCTGVRVIDEEGREVGESDFTRGLRPAGAAPWERLRAIARATYWYDFYGLSRRRALLSVRPPQPVWGFDVLVLLELCLRGPVLLVPEELFAYRIFWRKSGHDAAATLGGGGGQQRAIPVSWVGLAREMAGAIWRSPLPRASRLSLAARFLAEFCLRNSVVREGLRGESLGRIKGAWREGRYWLSFESASIAGLASAAGLLDRAAVSLKYQFGRVWRSGLRPGG